MSDSMSSDLASLRIERRDRPSRGSRGSRRTKAFIGGLVAVVGVLGVLGVAAYSGTRGRSPEVASPSRTRAPRAPVGRVAEPTTGTSFSATGYVVARTSALVGSPIVGRVARVLVSEGDRVVAGQALVELEDDTARAELATAIAEAAADRLHAAEARARLDEESLRADRSSRLAASGSISRATSDDSEAHRHALEAAAQAADADANARVAAIGSIRTVLRDHVVVAPISGTVVGDPIRPGALASPSSGPLVEILDFDSLVVETDVPEARIHALRPGARCTVVFDAFPDASYPCTTLDSGRRMNRARATVIVRVRLVDRPDGVLPDMAARVSFID